MPAGNGSIVQMTGTESVGKVRGASAETPGTSPRARTPRHFVFLLKALALFLVLTPLSGLEQTKSAVLLRAKSLAQTAKWAVALLIQRHRLSKW